MKKALGVLDVIEMDEETFLNILDEQLEPRIRGMELDKVNKKFVRSVLTEDEKNDVYTKKEKKVISENFDRVDTIPYISDYNDAVELLSNSLKKLKEVGPDNFICLEVSGGNSRYDDDIWSIEYKKEIEIPMSAEEFFLKKWRKQLTNYNKIVKQFKSIKENAQSIKFNINH